MTEGAVGVLMDPVFDDSEARGWSLDPPVELDVEGLCRGCNLVVLSHSHLDHFSPRTLARVSRAAPVLYPQGDGAIRSALSALGFKRPMPVHPGLQLDFGPLKIVPTRSEVDFPEMGALFLAGGRSFWNTVDTVVDERAISSVRDLVGRPDLLFASYQPLIEEQLRLNGLGSDFPFARYSQLLTTVWNINPRYVAPGSCGFRYRQEWLNQRAFPITERQFERDLRRVAPQLEVLHVPHGGAVELGATIEVELQGQAHVRRVSESRFSSYDWRPDRGVPPVTDPSDRPVTELRAHVNAFLDGEFLTRLAATETSWLEKMARLEARWHLEVVYSDGSSDHRHLHFDGRAPSWSPPTDGDFDSLRTTVPGSAIVRALTGRSTAFALSTELRKMNRLYAPHRGGVSAEAMPFDEPLGRVLYLDVDERFLACELSAAIRQQQVSVKPARPAPRKPEPVSGEY